MPMAITAVPYADRVVSGTLAVADPQGLPEKLRGLGVCQQARQVVLSVRRGDTHVRTATAGSGAFSFEVGMADGEAYALSSKGYLDSAVAWCGDSATEELEAVVDGDRDDVRDSSDLCRTAWGDSEEKPWCEVLPQVVTAKLKGDTLSGSVTATDAVDGACSKTSVYVLGDDGTSIPVTVDDPAGEVRKFSVSVAGLPASSRLRVEVEGGHDPGFVAPKAGVSPGSGRAAAGQRWRRCSRCSRPV